MLLSDAFETLRSHHVSGAPVVDASGRLVGVISLADLLPGETAGGTPDPSPPVALAHGHDRAAWDLYDSARSSQELPHHGVVADAMSTEVTSILEDTPLVEIARCLCKGHWHRVPVIDPAGNLSGIVSTMDLLAAMVNVVDESESAG